MCHELTVVLELYCIPLFFAQVIVNMSQKTVVSSRTEKIMRLCEQPLDLIHGKKVISKLVTLLYIHNYKEKVSTIFIHLV